MNLNPELLKTGDNIWAGNDYIDYNPDQNYGIVKVEAPLDVWLCPWIEDIKKSAMSRIYSLLLRNNKRDTTNIELGTCYLLDIWNLPDWKTEILGISVFSILWNWKNYMYFLLKCSKVSTCKMNLNQSTFNLSNREKIVNVMFFLFNVIYCDYLFFLLSFYLIYTRYSCSCIVLLDKIVY